jgi:hypothetical protein
VPGQVDHPGRATIFRIPPALEYLDNRFDDRIVNFPTAGMKFVGGVVRDRYAIYP